MNEPAGPLVRLHAVTRHYGKVTALDDVSLEIGAEIIGILGANGAGKSTLMRIVVGLLRADSGAVEICGVDARRHPAEARRHTGYVPEDVDLYERLTGREFLRFARGVKGAPLDDAAIDTDLAMLGLVERADRLIREYSLGMKKKIAILAAFAGSPRVLVLDEPLNALDVRAMRTVENLLVEARQQGTAVLVSSHVLSFVERACDRVAMLSSGRLVAAGTPRYCRELAELPGGSFDDVFFKLTERGDGAKA